MLPEPVDVETDLLGDVYLFEYLTETLAVTHCRPATVGWDRLGEAGDT
jgi:hypothetical protein